MSALKLISLLLDYPRDELWENRSELVAACGDAGLSPERTGQLLEFAADLLSREPMEAQERWLSLFDRGRSMSLLLFEHIHGESRDRGQAMVDLMETYRGNGFEIAVRELPDYLPLLLEYLSTRREEEARDWLSHVAHILELLAARASERGAGYALLFELLVEYSGRAPELDAMRQRVAREARDDTPAAIDAIWEEEAVRFTADAPDKDCEPAPRRLPGAATTASR